MNKAAEIQELLDKHFRLIDANQLQGHLTEIIEPFIRPKSHDPENWEIDINTVVAIEIQSHLIQFFHKLEMLERKYGSF